MPMTAWRLTMLCECRAVSNITAGNNSQIQAVLDAGIFPVVTSLITTGSLAVKKEAAWVVSNATTGGTPSQFQQLVDLNCIGALASLLSVHDDRLLTVVLEGLVNFASQTLSRPTHTQVIKQIGKAREDVETLSEHRTNNVRRLAGQLLGMLPDTGV